MPQEKRKFKYQLDLLDEKRAFVVIALTDRLTQAGKAAAFNCLAHYNAERGYSWASVPKIAKESGYSSSSTKTVKRGLVEIEDVGAFKIIWSMGGKVGPDNTHRCCPVMSWFRCEYERLRSQGKIPTENDEFADARVVNRNDTRAENPGCPGSEPAHPGFKTRPPRAENPTKRTQETNEEKRTKERDIPERSASGASYSSLEERAYGAPRPGNDNAAPYKQNKEQADRTLEQIRRVWPTLPEEAEYQPAPNSERAEAVRWHELLKSGLAASRIERAALHYISTILDDQWPCSLARFLSGHVHDYFDPDQPDLYIPEEHERPASANDNHGRRERKVSGIDWVNDPPF
ncbi:hypothetical protein IVA86_14410 [Bradyrhizobium sp. 146]|uniref:hypothetical protein n=1 Tax=Bradyrhizobium sp. 146 TaxID=2782622 RepID=UPI001FF78292|nr:hypothetical protein [Bradyrhizobium sp. 146]MCK1702591.1 hypothetical protein [Bradyrhizobium sp. 146]